MKPVYHTDEQQTEVSKEHISRRVIVRRPGSGVDECRACGHRMAYLKFKPNFCEMCATPVHPKA